MGLANGLALKGDAAIVELMFGDFTMLAMDQIVNMASKLISMYGRTLPLRLVVRCPVGGRRGYGATGSQSPQRHFIGTPDLRLYELSPVHPPDRLLNTCLSGGTPAVLFEDKVLFRWLGLPGDRGGPATPTSGIHRPAARARADPPIDSGRGQPVAPCRGTDRRRRRWRGSVRAGDTYV